LGLSINQKNLQNAREEGFVGARLGELFSKKEQSFEHVP
jgi:hypothetical protein